MVWAMNARQLEIFHAVMRSGTITGAASFLGISQPAVSKAMRANLERLGGLVHSQRVLLALTQTGMSREAAYAAVQAAAMKVWAGDGGFLELLKGDATATAHMSAAEIDACFDLAAHTKHVDTIFKRVFGKG